MSTYPRTVSPWRHLPASQIRLGGIYKTRIETGEVFGKVIGMSPPTPKTRNKTFLLVDIVSGMLLPKPKRAEDLAPLDYPTNGWHEFGGGSEQDRAWGPPANCGTIPAKDYLA